MTQNRVPCLSPQAHGVSEHIAGSEAALACLAGHAVPQGGEHRATGPVPASRPGERVVIRGVGGDDHTTQLIDQGGVVHVVSQFEVDRGWSESAAHDIALRSLPLEGAEATVSRDGLSSNWSVTVDALREGTLEEVDQEFHREWRGSPQFRETPAFLASPLGQHEREQAERNSVESIKRPSLGTRADNYTAALYARGWRTNLSEHEDYYSQRDALRNVVYSAHVASTDGVIYPNPENTLIALREAGFEYRGIGSGYDIVRPLPEPRRRGPVAAMRRFAERLGGGRR